MSEKTGNFLFTCSQIIAQLTLAALASSDLSSAPSALGDTKTGIFIRKLKTERFARGCKQRAKYDVFQSRVRLFRDN